MSRLDDRLCCDEYKSPWLQMVPSRFLNAPVVLQQDGYVMKLASPGALPENFTYSDPSIARKLNIDLSALPLDAYLPSAEGTLSDRTCPVCLVNFPSPAQMLEHRRALHKYTRQKLPADYERLLFVECKEVEVVVAEEGNGYTCILRNGKDRS